MKKGYLISGTLWLVAAIVYLLATPGSKIEILAVIHMILAFTLAFVTFVTHTGCN